MNKIIGRKEEEKDLFRLWVDWVLRRENLMKAELSKKLGISYNHFSNISSGNRRPGKNAIKKLIEYLNISNTDYCRGISIESSVYQRRILDLGTGREWLKYKDDNYSNDLITCIDRLYENIDSNVQNIELISDNILNYLEKYMGNPFNKVVACRVFEHFSPKDIGYILYLIYNVMIPNGKIEITVPNFINIFEDLNLLETDLMNTPSMKNFNLDMIKIHTEIFNEINDPHQSVWTPELAKYYLTLEGYFDDVKIESKELDGRDWYIIVTARRRDP